MNHLNVCIDTGISYTTSEIVGVVIWYYSDTKSAANYNMQIAGHVFY